MITPCSCELMHGDWGQRYCKRIQGAGLIHYVHMDQQILMNQHCTKMHCWMLDETTTTKRIKLTQMVTCLSSELNKQCIYADRVHVPSSCFSSNKQGYPMSIPTGRASHVAILFHVVVIAIPITQAKKLHGLRSTCTSAGEHWLLSSTSPQ